MAEKDKLLLLSKNPALIARIRNALEETYQIFLKAHASDLIDHPATVVLVDEALLDLTWLAFRHPNATYILLIRTAHSSHVDAALEAGVLHILLWPLNSTRLKLALKIATHQSFSQQLLLKRAHRFKRLSRTDPLTHICNRSALFEEGRKIFDNARRYQLPFSLLMIDIDRFKRVNDLYGHLVGDQVLNEFAHLLSSNLRGSDILGRFGGEEFVILLPHTTLPQAAEVARKLVQMTDTHHFTMTPKKSRITISIGVATLQTPCRHFSELLYEADQALYKAKKAGRNRFALFS